VSDTRNSDLAKVNFPVAHKSSLPYRRAQNHTLVISSTEAVYYWRTGCRPCVHELFRCAATDLSDAAAMMATSGVKQDSAEGGGPASVGYDPHKRN
jgi:hypothetical protein